MTSTIIRTPPPTTNKLDAVQRARVMRYSRKLGAVLGTTPFLLESCGSTVPVTLTRLDSRAKRHHHQRSVVDEPRTSTESLPMAPFFHAASSSKESLLSTSDCSSAESDVPLMVTTKSRRLEGKPRPVIFVDAVPLSSSDSRVQATPRLTRSPSLDIPPTPTTPTQASSVEARRRKMARVMRTLGENVPPELVFQPSGKASLENHPVPSTMVLDTRSVSSERSAAKITRRRSASVGATTQWQRILDLPAPVFSSSSKAPDDQRWVGEWNRRNIAQVQHELRNLRSH